MSLKSLPIIFICLLAAVALQAQDNIENNSVHYVGEIGISLGGAQYFGDLNSHTGFHAIKPSIGIFYRKFFNDYVGVRGSLHFVQVGYSDVYNKNLFEHTRNLSFNSNIFEFAVQGDFNFFRFVPGSVTHRFTPYITFGIGGFAFNPYAYYQNKKYYLQPLGTEGEGSAMFPGRKPYSLRALSFPIGAGVKFNVNRKINVAFEVVQHLTNTDYLDDVSKTYAGINVFPPDPNGNPSIASILQDRSNWDGKVPIGTSGMQRGNSRNKDQFLLFEVSVSCLLTEYLCPPQ